MIKFTIQNDVKNRKSHKKYGLNTNKMITIYFGVS